MIYFDNAATSGVKPLNVRRMVENALEIYSANPGRSGHKASARTADAVYSVREKVAAFFGANGPENVVFTLNCTHAINCVLKGVLHKGDHVIVSDLEHNAVMRPLVKTGVSYSKAHIFFDDDTKTVEEFKRLIKPNTRLIFCTAASNVFGKALPIAQIGEICRKKGILFGVDAAQTAGVMPINMQKMNIDFLCIAPHKGLYAPMGVGVLIARKPIENTLLEGGTGTNSLELFQPEFLPERLESGTLPVPAIMGIGAGIDFVNSKGIDKIYLHEMEIIRYLYSNLKKNGNITLYNPLPKNYSFAPVLSFNYKGLTSAQAAAVLAENNIAVRGGLHCAPEAHKTLNTLQNGTVRVSVSAFNNKNEVDTLVKLINTEKIFKINEKKH